MRPLLSLLVLLMSLGISRAAAWHTYRTTGSYRQVVDFAGHTYVLAGQTLLLCNADGCEMRTMNADDGLSGTRVFSIIMPSDSAYLAIVYDDCVIDLMLPDGSLLTRKGLYSYTYSGIDKTLNSFSVSQHVIYLACNFGFVEYDPLQDLFITTCPSPTPCTRAFRHQGLLYRQREGVGLERCPADANPYLPDQWEPVADASSIPDYTPAVDGARLQALPSFAEVGVSPCCLMKVVGGQLIAAQSIIYHKHYHPNQINGQLSRLDIANGQWHTTTYQTIFQQLAEHPKNFNGILQIAVDPADAQHVFLSTYGNLLFEFEGDSLIFRHTPQNSGLSYWSGFEGDKYGRTGGSCWDPDGNLWIVNNGTETPLCCLTADREWHQFTFPSLSGVEVSATLLFTAGNGCLWTLDEAKRSYLYVYDTKRTPFDSSDDHAEGFPLADENGNTLSISYICTLAEDQAGKIWILTTSGIRLVKDQAAFLADASHATTRPLLKKANANDGDTYLLDHVDCQCIAIDEADRKWIGTMGDGLYLVSPDGSEVLTHFTTDNSPLLGNGIYALAYDRATATLFASCDEGIVSLNTHEAGNADIDITSLPLDFSEFTLSSSLITSGETAPLVISRLPAETHLRITDASMQTVLDTHISNGTCTWNLVTAGGQYLPAGIYSIYASTPSLPLRLIATITREAATNPATATQSGK